MLNIPISLLLLRLNTLIILLIIAYDNSKLSGLAWSPGGGGTTLFKVYRFVHLQRVWVLSRFGLKTGINFDNYGLKSGPIFGAGNIYESLQTYVSSQYVTGTTN